MYKLIIFSSLVSLRNINQKRKQKNYANKMSKFDTTEFLSKLKKMLS